MDQSFGKAKIWISWETHRRSIELAKAFGCKYCQFDFSNLPRLLRYLRSSISTLQLLFITRYQVVFIQCPSLALAVLVSLVRCLKKFVFVIDAHNAVPNYLNRKTPVRRFLVRFCLKRAHFVLVTNDGLVEPVKMLGGNALILPDKLPEIAKSLLPDRFSRTEGPLITLICTFNWDEPIEVFLEAAKSLNRDFTLFVTGNIEKGVSFLSYASDKIRFTDYLKKADFDALIQNSDLLVDLTTDDKVLVCGAYEAVASGVPVLLVESQIARQTFSEGCLFSENSVQGYQHALCDFLDHRDEYRAAVRSFRPEFELRWEKAFGAVEEAIAKATGIPKPQPEPLVEA